MFRIAHLLAVSTLLLDWKTRGAVALVSAYVDWKTDIGVAAHPTSAMAAELKAMIRKKRVMYCPIFGVRVLVENLPFLLTCLAAVT